MNTWFAIHVPSDMALVSSGTHSSVPLNSTCNECSQGKLYTSDIDALEHWHTSHVQCVKKREHARPHDDPCFVWIHRVVKGEPGSECKRDQLESDMGMLREFRERISHLLRAAHILQDLAPDASKKRLGHYGSPLPALPESLVGAFQAIIEMYILRSHHLSLKNRIASTTMKSKPLRETSSVKRGLAELQSWETFAYKSANSCMAAARLEIIGDSDPSRRLRTIDSQKVGIEFLVTVLIDGLRSRTRKQYGSSQPDQDQKDWHEVYKEYLSKLRFQCFNKPRRKLFLDISAFEEELLAINCVFDAQRELLDNYRCLISVGVSTEASTEDAERRRDLEQSHLQHQLEQLEKEVSKIDGLGRKSEDLKKQVRQAIEILDEGHGKAIRVFTIVTLFFLPLSFVSTFLGMNTTDVDGLKWDQSIFWATSLPVTAAVLMLAFLYGYKSDEISDWVKQHVRMHSLRLRDADSCETGREEAGVIERSLRAFGGLKKRATTLSLMNGDS